MAVEEYNKDNPDEEPIADTMQNPPEPSKDDVGTEKITIEEPFSQDDLPF